MNSDDSMHPVPAAIPSAVVTLSPWINERFPALDELLTARDVARLTRRPRWLLAGLTLFGRFPRKRRYHGRSIGWRRSDVVHWLTKDLRAIHGRSEIAYSSRVLTARRRRRRFPNGSRL